MIRTFRLIPPSDDYPEVSGDLMVTFQGHYAVSGSLLFHASLVPVCTSCR